MTLLVGKKNIEGFCRRKFDPTIATWIRTQAFPAAKLDGVWHSDTELIVAWFRKRIVVGSEGT